MPNINYATTITATTYATIATNVIQITAQLPLEVQRTIYTLTPQTITLRTPYQRQDSYFPVVNLPAFNSNSGASSSDYIVPREFPSGYYG